MYLRLERNGMGGFSACTSRPNKTARVSAPRFACRHVPPRTETSASSLDNYWQQDTHSPLSKTSQTECDGSGSRSGCRRWVSRTLDLDSTLERPTLFLVHLQLIEIIPSVFREHIVQRGDTWPPVASATGDEHPDRLRRWIA